MRCFPAQFLVASSPSKTTAMPNTTLKPSKRSTKRQTVPLMAWVKPEVKAEMTRLATQDGLSLSRTAGAFLAEAIRQKLHIQHAVLLEPIIETTIRKQISVFSNRLALLLVRSIFASEQTRSLTTNILGRQQGVTQPVLDDILTRSGNLAKRNLTRRTPQLEALIAEVEHWLRAGEEARRNE